MAVWCETVTPLFNNLNESKVTQACLTMVQITHTSIPWKVAVVALGAGIIAEESRATIV
jgi:hypothetical protein